MVGGINGVGLPVPAPDRVRREPPRQPDTSTAPERVTSKNDQNTTGQNATGGRTRTSNRPVEESASSEGVRLQRFRADQVPLRGLQAQKAYTDVATQSQPQSQGVEIAGIDVRA